MDDSTDGNSAAEVSRKVGIMSAVMVVGSSAVSCGSTASQAGSNGGRGSVGMLGVYYGRAGLATRSPGDGQVGDMSPGQDQAGRSGNGRPIALARLRCISVTDGSFAPISTLSRRPLLIACWIPRTWP